MEIQKLKNTAKEYLIARKKFLDIANDTIELSGNDNIIGRIGEFIAYQLLKSQGRCPTKNQNKSERGYDLTCDNGIKVSVKTITHENETQRTTRIKEPWDELIFVQLNAFAEVERIGILTKSEFEFARTQSKKYGLTPYCQLTMLNPKGLIGKYGTVLQKNELEAKALL
ncbi:MAG: hypothetical protein KDD15_16120 [Lewinella sp.]|nr:hypothetical protein [Lewinella sp.]